MLSLRSYAALAALASVAAGCGKSGSSGTATTGSGTTGAGDQCAPGTGCPSVKSDCLGLVDNSSKTPFALRMSHLTVTKPTVLATGATKTLLDQGVAIDLPNCMSQSDPPSQFFPPTDALGTFSLLMQFDTTAGTLTVGGGSPEMDPTAGYCFVNQTIQSFMIKPLVVQAPLGSDGSFDIAMPENVVLPVFSDIMSTNVILLPLQQIRLHDAKVSSDHNCIGTFNANLDPNNLCLADDQTPQYIDGGSLDGFASLEDADKVVVSQLGGKSLCVLLTGDSACAQYCDATKSKCARDANNQIVFKGDWCSTTNAAATDTCHDAVQLTGTFAASSVAMKTSCP